MAVPVEKSKPDHVSAALVNFGGPVSALLIAITSKPNWAGKIEDSGIRAAWRREFAEEVARLCSNADTDAAVKKKSAALFMLSPAAVDRVFDRTVAMLRNANDFPPCRVDRSRHGEGDFGGRDIAEYGECEGVDPNHPYRLCVELAPFELKCQCDCAMCQDGSFRADEFDGDGDDAVTVAVGTDAAQPGAAADGDEAKIALLKAACKCWPDHKERLAALRSEYLGRTTLAWRLTGDAGTNAVPLLDELRRLFRAAEDRAAELTRVADGNGATEAQLAAAAAWHPGSGRQVLDVVHPSSAAFVDKVHGAARGPVKYGRMALGLGDEATSSCRWPAAEFEVSAGGVVRLREGSAVAGLGAGAGPGAAGLLNAADAAAFEAALGAALTTLLPGFAELTSLPAVAKQARDQRGLGDALQRPGATLRVIAKAASIHVDGARPEFPAGSWHLEGVAEDAIAATGIVYVPDDADHAPLEPTSLAFRVAVSGEDTPYPQDGADWIETHLGFRTGEAGYERGFDTTCELGSLPTEPGTALFFPNFLQHRVSAVKLSAGSQTDSTREARRRIVVFWLVHPNAAPPSAADVLRGADPAASPAEATAEALAWRELLMAERKYEVVRGSEVFERVVSLCEH